MEFDTWVVSEHRYRDQTPWLRRQMDEKPWLVFFVEEDPMELRCGSLNSRCRLEPSPFDDCFVDRFFFTEKGSGDLLGAALTMRIAWDGSREDLPEGWEDTVRRCYRDCRDAAGSTCNTLVGMQVFTLSHHRNKGLSGRFLGEMAGFAKKLGYEHMVIPALPPTQFTKEGAATPFETIATALRDDGLPADHWVRLHVRKGAKVIGHHERSHCFAMSLRDFSCHISSDPIDRNGEHLVRLDRDLSFGLAAADTWQKVHVDREQGLVLFRWGCVWVEYP